MLLSLKAGESSFLRVPNALEKEPIHGMIRTYEAWQGLVPSCCYWWAREASKTLSDVL